MASVNELRRLAGSEEESNQTTPEGQRVGTGSPSSGQPASSADVAQLRRLAGEEPQGPSWSDVGQGAQEFSSQFLRSVVDAAAPLAQLNPMGGQTAPSGQQIAEQSGGIVATEEPDSFAGRTGEMGGLGATFAVPGGAGAGLVSRSAARGGGLLRRLGRGARNIVAESGRAFRQRPGRFVAGEGAVGSAAGASGFAAEQMFPDSDAARVLGELAGGVAAQGPLFQVARRGGQKVADTVRAPFSETGSRRRAQEAVQGVQTPAEQARPTQGLDEATTINPETGLPYLTPPQRQGTPGSQALERTTRESRPEMARGREEQLAEANVGLQQQARDIGAGGTPEDTAATLEQGQAGMLRSMNERLNRTAQRIDQRIRQLGSGANREEANRIAREEVQNALEFANRQERQLFSRVDDTVAVPSSNAQNALGELSSDLGEDQLEDIPRRARMRLNPDSDRFIGDSTNVREMRSLQSKLREESRIARSNERFNKARIADDIADAITDDLAAAGEQSQPLQEAVQFSRSVRQRFRRGAVGKILGREATGEPSVRPGETLEQTIGGGGPSARGAMDEIRQALDDPEISARTQTTSDEFNQAASDFIRQQFVRETVRDGEFGPQRAQNFLRQNDELLTRMPQVREELETAVREGNVQRIAANRRSRTKTNDPRVSRATLFIRKGPDKAFQEIADNAPQMAARDTQQLLNRAKRDETGRAVQGLKRGYIDFLMQPSNQRDVQGQRVIDGMALRERRQNPSIAAAERRLLSSGERERLDTITSDMVKLQRSRESPRIGRGSDDLPVADQPGKMRQRLARIVGAGVGRNTAAAAGSGGTVQIPGQVADAFNDLANAGFEDPAGMLLRAGVDDETLWRELLQADVGPDGNLPQKASNRLNAWVAGVVSERQQGSEETLDEGDGGQR